MRFFLLENSALFSTVVKNSIAIALFLLIGVAPALATPKSKKSGPKPAPQASTKAKPDVLVFLNGDRITGNLVKADGVNIYFATDEAGQVTVPWTKIKSFDTSKRFAVLTKKEKAQRKHINLSIPVGSLHLNGKTLTIADNNASQNVLVSDISYVIDDATYQKNVGQEQGLFHGITGSVTAGYSQVNSTYNSTTLTSGINLTRIAPAVPWMKAARRTLLNFSNTYSTFTQSPNPTAVTNILHGSLEEDEYLKPRFYLLEQAIYDRNSVEGLALQQVYGGGLGYTVIKKAMQELDLSATVNYTKQQFDQPVALNPNQTPSATQNLIGATFADNYTYKLPHHIVLTEVSNVTPEFNYFQAYTANATVGVTMPIIKNFGLSIQAIDNYLNDPPPGFKGNSTQYTTGLTYSIP
ncbi:MAG: DUF481 domain-containing protein [Acidobacteriaceae bacterium]